MNKLIFITFFLTVGYIAGLVETSRTDCFIDRYETIRDVGGCDRHGYCSYSTESGTVGNKERPVKGETVHIQDMCKTTFYPEWPLTKIMGL